jgi:PTH1 family peptidyl-tRNA hydrolase
LRLIVGLGNPGPEYAATRHNVGFMVAGLLAERAGIALKRKGYQGIYGVGRLDGADVAILLPQTYMNRSGASVGPACQSLGVVPGDLIVVHDEIDLDYGCLRVKQGGGHGGHNGLRSLNGVLNPDYVRLRVGVGRPSQDGDVSAYVLSRFNAAERAILAEFIAHAADAVELILTDGCQAAMNVYNNRDLFS